MRLLRPVTYVVMMFVAVFACRLYLLSHDLLRVSTTEVQQALMRTAIAVMENGEWLFLEGEAYRDAEKASQYEENAKYLEQRSKAERSFATRSRTRGDYFADLAYMDAQQANQSHYEMLRDDKLRLELLENITTDNNDLTLLEEEKNNETFVLSHVCSYKVFNRFCTLFGGVPDLPKQIDLEIQRIAHEYGALCQTERQEFLHGLVTEVLLGHASKYNHTANDLFQMAKLYDAMAKKDAEAARQYNDTAILLYHEEQAIEERMQHELQWIQDNNDAAEHFMLLADHHMLRAHRFSTEAALLALLSMVFFVPVLVLKCLCLFQATIQADGCDTEKIVWRISYIIQHVLIFLVVTSLLDPDFLLHLDSYDIPKRVMIIGWFAYLAAGLQSVLLHSVPQLMNVECPLDVDTARTICAQFLLRMIVHTLSFALELLIVWLLFRNVVFATSSIQVYSSGMFYLLFVVTVCLHIVFLDQRHNWNFDGSTDQSTVLSSDDDESMMAASERSALLLNGDESQSPTERLPIVYFQGFNRLPPSTSNASSNLSSSSFTMNIQMEGIKLLIILDILLLICSWLVFQNGVTMSTTSKLHENFIALAWFSGVVIACLILGMAIFPLCRVMILPSLNRMDKKPILSIKTVHTYNSIDL